MEGFKPQLANELALELVDDLVELEEIVEEAEGDEEEETPIRDYLDRIKKKEEEEKEREREEVFAISGKIRKCENDNNVCISSMTTKMRVKYDKYWGTPNTINILLMIVVVLDPRCKVKYVNHFVNYLFNED